MSAAASPEHEPNHRDGVGRMHALSVTECYERLAGECVGRVVYTEAALPAITPVNYALDGHHIVFRTVPGSRLARAVTGQVVAFEVDRLDPETRTGWSVVLTGVAHELETPSEQARAAALRLAPWAGGQRDLFLTVTPGIVTGRIISD